MIIIEQILKGITHYILNGVLWVWSHSPVFSLSNDEKFATLEVEQILKKEAHLRISLINIMLGDRIIYFISFDIKEKKIKPCHFLRLKSMKHFVLTEKDINEKQEKFRKHIKGLKKEDLEIEKEKLCYHIQNEEKRIDTSINKLNIYTTIILTVLPLVLAMLDMKKILTLSIPILIGIFFMIYALINICAYIFGAISVQGIHKSTFKDLREKRDKSKEILIQYQYDWQYLIRKSDLFVSFVLNLQEWVELVLVLAVVVSVSIPYSKSKSQNQTIKPEYDMVRTVIKDEINEPYNDSASEWQEVVMDIQKKRCKKIIFIVNKEENLTFLSELRKYDDLEIKVVIDNTLEKEKMKIIEEE